MVNNKELESFLDSMLNDKTGITAVRQLIIQKLRTKILVNIPS